MDNICLGIAKETINLQIHEDLKGKVELHKLIDPMMLIMSEFSKECNINVLNNAKNNMMDNFRSIKEIMSLLEGK